MTPEDFTERAPGKTTQIREDGVVAFVPDKLTDDSVLLSAAVHQRNEEAVTAIGALGAIIPNLPSPDLVTSPFLAREAVLSSRIEGTQTEVDQLYLFEVEEETDQQSSVPAEEVEDRIEVRNYLRALRYGLAQIKTRPIHARLLREMHEILLKDARGEEKAPGHYRWKQAFLGARTIEHARYVAPPPDKVDDLMNDLELCINAAESCVPSLVRIARIHYQFEAIHPFADGNGRLGRLLISLMLSTRGLLSDPFLYLSAYFERYRTDYADSLWQISRNGEWEEWYIFFLDGVIHEAHDAASRAGRLLKLREDTRTKLHSVHAASTALQLADHLFKVPAISVKIAQRVLDLKSFGGANKVVDKLCEIGFLKPATSRQRNRVFIATPIIELLR